MHIAERRGEPDPVDAIPSRSRLDTGEDGLELASPLRPDERMELVDDDGIETPEQASRVGASAYERRL